MDRTCRCGADKARGTAIATNDIHPLTHPTGPRYNARPGSRVPMFTSRCTTPPACALAQPRPDSIVGRSSAARFLVSGTVTATRHPIARTDHPMTELTQLRIARPRHAGQRRPAASWRAPIGARGTGAHGQADVAGVRRAMRMGRLGDRKPQVLEVTGSTTIGFGYRSLDAGQGGAGSGFRGDAP
jgi:hypothetical protein